MNGLLPPTAEQRSVGRHGFETVRRPGLEDQLLALCRLRAQTKSWNRLAILLWLDGWQIATDRLRRALQDELPDPARLGLNPRTEKGLDRLDEYARRFGPAFARRAGLGRVGPTIAANAAMAGIVAALGGEPYDEEDAVSIERVTGLTRGRTDTVGDAGPWLSGPAAPTVDLTDFARRIRRLVQNTTESELSAARPRARMLAVDLPQIARALELAYGRNFAGHGLFARGHVTPEMAVGCSLLFARVGMGRQLDALAASLSVASAQSAGMLPGLEAYAARHPEQRRTLHKIGLQGLLERGELVPFEPAELEALLGNRASSEQPELPTGPE
jgi:hypothetical protein